jgi:mevalonate kinase
LNRRLPGTPFTVSAPGKLILMGEHAVVYGRPALVAAIDLRLFARFSPGRPAAPDHPARLRIALPGLGTGCDVANIADIADIAWPEVSAYAREARGRWESYAAEPGPAAFRALRGGDPLHLVKVALGEAADALAALPGRNGEPEPLDLHIESHLPLGSGMGSSAAAAVAVVAGYLLFRGMEIDLPWIERLAHEVERRQHGTPSGVDAATVARGGLLWAQRKGEAAGLAVEPVVARSALLRRIAVYDTGTPAEATGAVVAAVRERAAVHPRRHERLLDQIDNATRGLRAELTAEVEDPRRVVELIRAAQAALEALGVVPAAVRERVRAVEAAGGAAKISGAGALTGAAAGTLLAYHAEPDQLVRLPALALPQYPVHLGAAGLRREETR